MQKLIIIGIIAATASGIHAQEVMDFNSINAETYRLYLAGKWDSLNILGKQALRQGTDFYYLRMRMGIASYETKNFRKAAIHFNRALRLNQGDPGAMEYLYFALLMCGKTEDAMRIRNQFRGELALRLPVQKGKLVQKAGAGILQTNSNTRKLLSGPENPFHDLPPGIQYLTRRFTNLSLNLENSITPGFRLVHNYNYLNKVNHLYYNDGFNSVELPDQQVGQHQYYFSPVVTTPLGCTFSPMIHLIGFKYETLIPTEQGFQGGTADLERVTERKTDIATGLDFSRAIGPVDLNLGGWFARLNHARQLQGRFGFTFFPMGNLNLYAGGYLNAQYEWSRRDSTNRFIPEIFLGWAIREKVWLELNAAAGNMTNYLENNGAVIYNSFSEKIRRKATVTVSVPVSQKGSLLFLGGRWSAGQSQFFAFEPVQQPATNTIEYQTISIYGGITWKF